MAMPTNVDTGLVSGRFIVGVADGPDPDREPDAIPAQGTVTFAASVPYLPNPTSEPAPVTVLKVPIIAVLDADGYLCTPDPASPLKAGARGIRLIATDDPDLSVQDWTWNVTYVFQAVNGVRPQIASHSMALPAGTNIDLTSVVKVPSSTGIGVEQAEALAASAQAAAVAAAEAAQLASEAAQANDAGVAALLTTGAQTAPILAAKVDRGSLYVEASDYGAVGDGVTDDTVALQAWLDAPGPVRRLHDGIYRITAGLTSTEPGRMIVCDGATILGDAPDATVLTVAGDGSTVRVNIDGLDTAAWGVHATGDGIEIVDSLIENLHSTTGPVNAIRVTSLGGSVVRGNTLRNLVSVGNDITGDVNGASRAIVITSTEGSAIRDHIVENNRISDVLGEEGDAIHVSFNSGGRNARARIVGNTIHHVSRRAIKLQAGGVWVEGNTYTHPDTPPTNPSALLDVQYVDDVTITGNTLDSRFSMGVQITGYPEDKTSRVTVANNRINGSQTSSYAVVASHCADLTVTGNHIRDFLGPIRVTSTDGLLIDGNTLRGGIETGFNVGIKIGADCGNVIARGNIAFDGPRNTVVENDSPNAVIENNHARFAGTGQAVRGLANAAGSIYRANTTSGSGAAAFGAFTDQTVTQTRALAADGSAGVGADISWGTENPSTATPNRRASRGDVVFNQAPSPGGFVGWICVTAGTPGVWKTFAVVAS